MALPAPGPGLLVTCSSVAWLLKLLDGGRLGDNVIVSVVLLTFVASLPRNVLFVKCGIIRVAPALDLFRVL